MRARRAWAQTVAVLTLAGVAAGVAPASSSEVDASATGAGHRISGGELRSFSFAAVRQSDGTVTGQAHVYPRSLGAFAQISIDCLSFPAPNIAHMSGTVTFTSDPAVFRPDEYVHFAVQDNGEGNAAEPDRITGIPENQPVRCDEGAPPAPFNPILRGDVRVEP
jgi:hypothetical protein